MSKNEQNDPVQAHHADRGILGDLGEAAAEALSAAGKVVEATGKGASELGESTDHALEKHEARKQQQD